MIQKFVDQFMAAKTAMLAEFKANRVPSYEEIFQRVIAALNNNAAQDEYGWPSPKRITVIDDGDYQGTRVFVVGANGYQPSTYWFCLVSYGSCSGCDALQQVQGWDDEVTDKEAEATWTLALHMVQSLKVME